MKFGIMLPHSGALAGVEAIRRVALEADDLVSTLCGATTTLLTIRTGFFTGGRGLLNSAKGSSPTSTSR